MRHRLLLTLGVFGLCASLAACGGSSTTATATTASSARAATSVPATTAPTIAATTSAPTAPVATVAATTAAPAASGTTIAVELKDFAIALDKSTVTAGMVTFTIKNTGPSPHNFSVLINGEEKGIAPTTLDPGKTATLTLDLKAGAYTYRCNIPGHDLLGMKGTLTVK